MRQRLKYYLSNRRYVIIMALALLVIIGLLMLVFTPIQFTQLVNTHRIWLMWGVIGMLLLQIYFLLREINDDHATIEQLQKHRSDDTDEPDKYNFYDEKGELRLSANPNTIYYLESADNYVIIHYLGAGKMEKLMIRNSLKNIEWRFRGKGLVRCHRSYIVNLSRVQMLRRSEGDVVLDFGDERLTPIPVSKSYAQTLMEQFTDQGT